MKRVFVNVKSAGMDRRQKSSHCFLQGQGISSAHFIYDFFLGPWTFVGLFFPMVRRAGHEHHLWCSLTWAITCPEPESPSEFMDTSGSPLPHTLPAPRPAVSSTQQGLRLQSCSVLGSPSQGLTSGEHLILGEWMKVWKVPLCVCVWVCKCERERDRESGLGVLFLLGLRAGPGTSCVYS